MEQRLDYGTLAPEALGKLLELEKYVRGSGIEQGLLHLVKLRASQLNGCAYCVDMHSQDARAGGEAEERLHSLATWREAPFYSERERAALAWTEALTLLADGGVSDGVWTLTREHFGEKEVVDLTMAVVTINSWNRIAVSFRPPVGVYRPGGRERI